MDRLNVPHNAFVFVGDGQRALFLRNTGDAKFPNLTVERVFSEQNPPTREQGTDRPGRGFKRAATNRRSSMEDYIGALKHARIQPVAAEVAHFEVDI